MKDIVGNELAIGDNVSIAVVAIGQAHLRIGKIVKFEGEYARIRYTVRTYKDMDMVTSVLRSSDAVIKVINGVQT